VLIAEDLLLLLTDDTSGKLSAPFAKVEVMLAGANLIELALMGKVDLVDAGEPVRFMRIVWSWKDGRLVVRDPSPTGDAVLDSALRMVPVRQGKVRRFIKLSEGMQRKLYKRFVDRGIVRHEQSRIGLDRWPAQDSTCKSETRRRVIQALVAQTTPDTRSAALIALLHTTQCEPKIVDHRVYGMSKGQLVKRGEEISNSGWAPDAIRNSVDVIIDETRRAALDTEGGGG
jgi:hypothetical protein